MRLDDDQIKQAILHPEEEIRLTALQHFSDAHRQDESIMPLVIRAVELHGRERAFRLLRSAERLPQTEPTIAWLIAELRQFFDLSDADQDNYRFALSQILCEADPVLVSRHRQEILRIAAFPDELREALEQTVEMANLDWTARWQAFSRFTDKMNEMPRLTKQDYRRLHRFVRHLGRNSEPGAEHVLHLLEYPEAIGEELGDWLEPWVVRLAGEMRLEGAIPHLIERALGGADDISDECGTALGQIGGDAVVQAIADVWPEANEEFRSVTTEALEHIHTDLCVQTCLEFLRDEEDGEVALSIGHALLSHFAIGGIEPVRQMVLGEEDDLDPEQSDLRDHLVATCVIMGASFPEFDVWHAEALQTNWGWGDYRPQRLADAFQDGEDRDTPRDDDWLIGSEHRLDPDEFCPCGSGETYGECCWEKEFDWVVAEDGTVQRSLPMSGELFEMLQAQREAFIEEHGREPGSDDFVFPNLSHPEHLEHQLVQAMKMAGVDPAVIFAFEQAGLLVTEENQDRIPDVDLEAWDAAVREYERRHRGLE